MNAPHFHLPVLLKEVMEIFSPKGGEKYIDATVGEGGHAIEIAKAVKPSGKVLGIDWDPEILERAEKRIAAARLKDVVTLAQGSFGEIGRLAREQEFVSVDGILLDLGFSSWHIGQSGRGFSFPPRRGEARPDRSRGGEKEEPLDMRYDPSAGGLTAAEILERFRGEELERILKEYGEERFSRQIARTIVEARKTRPVRTTGELVEIIKRAVPRRFWPKGLHVATKTFQALRIAVNHELENLQTALPQALELLRKDGRPTWGEPRPTGAGKLIVISFHSLEDRIAKKQFQAWEKEGRVKLVTKKPVTASRREAYENARARSAKLRALVRLA